MEATLVNLVADIRNLSWVFIVLGALFTGLIGYLFTVSRGLGKLESDIHLLELANEEK